MNTRKIGKKLEIYVADRLKHVLYDSSIRPTKASGGSTELGDIYCSEFLVECKKRNTSSITIKEKVWDKLFSELPLGSMRIPLYVLENKNKKRWVVMDLEHFFQIIKKNEKL